MEESVEGAMPPTARLLFVPAIQAMTSVLRERIGKVHSAAARLRWTWAVARFLTGQLLVFLVLASFDALVRFSTPVGRWLLTLAALAATGRLVQRYLWPCFRYRPPMVATARRVEAQYPHLAEHVSSAVAFLETPDDDPAAGSLAMRQAVIATAEALTAELDLSAALDARPARRAVAQALAASLVCVAVAVWQPQATRIALARLLLPFSEAAWPRRHELALVDPPRRVAAGSEVRLTLVDRKGRLPQVVELHVEPLLPAANQDAAQIAQVRRLAGGVPRLSFSLGSVHHSVRYRLRGGDDDTMGWQTLTVVEPPAVRQFQVRVEPPAYTGLPPQEAGTNIQALAGSQLVVTVELDRAVARGQLRLGSRTEPVPAQAEQAGRRWTVGRSPPWEMVQADTAELELFDADGTKFVPLRLSLTPIPDRPPSLVWSLPDDETVATPEAELRVAAQVQDDYGVQRIVLHAACEEEGLEVTFPLYGVAEPPGLRRAAGRASDQPPSGDVPDAGDLVVLDTPCPLTRLPARPGQVWTLSLAADDFKPQTARAPSRRLTIVAASQMQQLLAARRQAVLAQLAEVLRMARRIGDELAQASQRADSALAPEEALRLQAIQFGLTQMADALAAGPGGVEGKLAALLADGRANGLADDKPERTLAQWLKTVRTLNQEVIPAVEQRLAQAQQAVQTLALGEKGPKSRVEVSSALAAAREEHARLVQSLEAMLGVAQRWEGLARMASQVSEMEQLQRSLTGQIEALHLQSLSAAAEQAAALRAEGRRLAQQQGDLARRMEELLAVAEQLASQPSADDPEADARLQAARDALRRQAIGSTMRQGAMQLAQGQYDPAASLARQALEGLGHLSAILEGTPPASPGSHWQAPVAALVASQRELAAQIEQLDAASATPRARATLPTSRELAARQRRLAHDLDAIRPQMPRLFQWVAEEAHRAMQRSEQLLDAGQTGAAAQHAAHTALALLQQLQEASANDPQSPQKAASSSPPPDAAASPEHPAPAELKLVLLWQEWIARQTAELERQRPPSGSWTPAQRDAIEDLARQQQRLAQALETWLMPPANNKAPQP
jgi:hypothetical protein